MDAHYPDDRFIREVLDEDERQIGQRTKQVFSLSLDKAKASSSSSGTTAGTQPTNVDR